MHPEPVHLNRGSAEVARESGCHIVPCVLKAAPIILRELHYDISACLSIWPDIF